jgi:plasmid stabilization system protein ParE
MPGKEYVWKISKAKSLSVLNVFLSPLAERKLLLLLDYVELEWSKAQRDVLLEKILRSFNRIARHPKSSPESQEFPNLYKCVVTEHTSFFYRISSNEVEIITLVDNRQDPDKIAIEIGKYFQLPE